MNNSDYSNSLKERQTEHINAVNIINRILHDWIPLKSIQYLIKSYESLTLPDRTKYSNVNYSFLNKYGINEHNFLSIKRVIKTFLEQNSILHTISINPDTDNKYISMIEKIINSELKISDLLQEIKDLKNNKIDISESHFGMYNITIEDIINFERVLENYLMGKRLIDWDLSIPLTDIWHNNWNHSENIGKTHENNQGKSQDSLIINKYVCFNISLTNGEIYVIGIDVDKSKESGTKIYREGDDFILKEDSKVFSINSGEKNIDIENLIGHTFTVTRWTYLSDNYWGPDIKVKFKAWEKYVKFWHNYFETIGTKAFFVKIRSKTTWKEYITYSI